MKFFRRLFGLSEGKTDTASRAASSQTTERQASTPSMEVRRFIAPASVVAVVAVIPEGARKLQVDQTEFVLQLHRATNPELMRAVEAPEMKTRLAAGFLVSDLIDLDTAMPISDGHVNVLIDSLEYDRSTHSAYLQAVLLGRSNTPVPKAVMLATIYRSVEPSVVFSELPPRPLL